MRIKRIAKNPSERCYKLHSSSFTFIYLLELQCYAPADMSATYNTDR